MSEEKQNEITVSLRLQGIDEATEKLERYVQLLKETKTLADELAAIKEYYQNTHGVSPEKISLVAEGRSQLSFGKYTVSKQLFP
ncbi:hypothetical protein [Enterococcus sp. DIV1420a]|uniref:hypothetical protein n=1 Tax=Enterococcus sp. DIV1420a TaxID=2774672 RepID=UPI003F22F4CD